LSAHDPSTQAAETSASVGHFMSQLPDSQRISNEAWSARVMAMKLHVQQVAVIGS